MPTEFKLQRNPKYKDLYGDDDGKYPDLQNLPYIDEKRNEVLDKKPEKPNYRQYAEQGQNPLFAYMEQNMNPEYDKKRDIQLQRTAAVNTLGELIRNVIDLHYGKKGATISKRKPQNNAYAELLGMREKYDQDEDKYNQMYLKALMDQMSLDRQDARWGVQDNQWEQKFDWDKEKYKKDAVREDARWEDNKGLQQQRIDAAKENKKNADQQKKEAQAKKDQFPVSTGRNADGTIKQGYLTPNEFNDVLNYIGSLGNEDYNKIIRSYQRGELSKFELEPLVSKYWNNVYDVNQDGRMIEKKYTTGKGGYLKDNNPTVNTGNTRFQVNGKIYNIPSDEVKAFKQDFPNAKQL